MNTLEELLSLQENRTTSVFNALANFKKLGQAKMTQAVTRQRLETLKQNFDACRSLDAQIRLRVDEKQIAQSPYFKQKAVFGSCEDAFNETADFMAEVLASYAVPTSPSEPNVSMMLANSNVTSSLPRMSLPTFDGTFDKWESFRDRFVAMIVRDTTLSDVQRMHYLCSCVTEEASEALSHLSVTADNFKIAWKLMMSRYENPRRLVNVHLHTLFNLPALKNETAESLRALRDKMNASIEGLRHLRRPVDQWSEIFVFVIAQKMNTATRKAWEFKLGNSTEYPEYSALDEFLDSRIRALEAITPPDLPSADNSAKNSVPKGKKQNSVVSHATSASPMVCSMCNAAHLLYQCPSFLEKSPSQRLDLVRSWKRCVNCFNLGHFSYACSNSRTCKTCHKKHHSLLHLPEKSIRRESEPSATDENVPVKTDVHVASHLVSPPALPATKVLLATARVRVYSPDGRFVHARALLDQGSAATIITEGLAQRLKLARIRQSACITGVGDAQSTVRRAANIAVSPRSSDSPAFATTALIIRSLTKYVPDRENVGVNWPHVEGLTLADPNPLSHDPINILLGADLYGALILDGVRKGSDREPVAQNSALGWILSGMTGRSTALVHKVTVCHTAVQENVDFDLRQFWEIEEVPRIAASSPEDEMCEEHFRQTHYRLADGRYVVSIPFKRSPPIEIGDSRAIAVSHFLRMEKRLSCDSSKAAAYQNFLTEYERLDHMAKVRPEDTPRSQIVYIPHHAVFKGNQAASNIRVVFNASCRTSNGTSLNDHMSVGPKLQTDVASVILQWRKPRYVCAADITKMYRQIRVRPEDTDYQRILWRSSPNGTISEYRLLTVTYGTAAAPNLALRVLKQLVTDEGSQFPLAVPVLMCHVYIDDCLFGADNLSLARETRDQLRSLLARGGFHLRKWASNSATLLEGIDAPDLGVAPVKGLQQDDSLKVLGIVWHPARDEFRFQVKTGQTHGLTKRAILSAISGLFDPLGWAMAVVISAKIIM